MKLDEIMTYPLVVDNNHESIYRKYHILDKVLEMIDRGDSKETIFEVVGLLESNNVYPLAPYRRDVKADHPDDVT